MGLLLKMIVNGWDLAFERFKRESDSESVEQESVPSKDDILGLEEYNYPVEMLSKEQEKDDINEVERRGSAPRRRDRISRLASLAV